MDEKRLFEKEYIKILCFSDLHYKKGMYASSISDLEEILKRAEQNNVDFILNPGDLCNNYVGSPELFKVYLNNPSKIPVYGVYGNHELEGPGNSMQVVTPLLTNQKHRAVWGTDDGKIGDGTIGYYYVDDQKTGIRIICTDTNYSYNTACNQWQHNFTNSYGAPPENIYINSLGPTQLKWLENVLMDAAVKNITCIILSHANFNAGFGDSSSPDAKSVQEIINKVNSISKGTVIMCVNGHYHINRFAVCENVLYLDINATRNAYWAMSDVDHYTNHHTFEYVKYDDLGNPISKEEVPLTMLTQSKNTYFTKDPLSAVVTISNSGKITISGKKSNWLYNVLPPIDFTQASHIAPKIPDYECQLF